MALLHFASGVLLAGRRVARGGLHAGAVSALVGLPGLTGLVDATRARLLTSAHLLRASGDRRVAHSLLASARIAVVFPRLSNIVHSSHVIAFWLYDGAATLVASYLSILVTPASRASVLLRECLSNLVGVAIVEA